MRDPPFVVVSIQALHTASGFYHSMDSLIITMFIYVLVCANIILYWYLLGPMALLDLMASIMPTSAKGGALRPFTVS